MIEPMSPSVSRNAKPKQRCRQDRHSRFGRDSVSPSATLIVRQGLVEIVDTLIETLAVRVKTDIRAGQTLPRQGGFTGALDLTRREQCGKEANEDHP
jgi:hypothetical protein